MIFDCRGEIVSVASDLLSSKTVSTDERGRYLLAARSAGPNDHVRVLLALHLKADMLQCIRYGRLGHSLRRQVRLADLVCLLCKRAAESSAPSRGRDQGGC
jgi:hypothetical protein